MKRLGYVSLLALLLLAFGSWVAAEEMDYKAGYEKQMKVGAETQAVIDGVVAWLKEHNYEKYPMAKMKVEDALDQAGYAEETKKKAEAFAAQKDWKQAYMWANQYWQYQVKIADSGLRAKQMIEDSEAAEKEK